MSTRLFGSSGIRRLADQELLNIAFRVGVVAGKQYRHVVIGGDTRISTEKIKAAIFAGIKASGAMGMNAGLVPTPTLAYVSRYFNMGLMVTASHNPPEYNGIKVCNPDGAAFDDAQENQVEELVELVAASPNGNGGGSAVPEFGGAITRHLTSIMERSPSDMGKLKVVLDCGCGAGCVITPLLMKQMNIKPIPINCQPSSVFPRASEPTEESLTELMKTVVKTKSQVGLAHDGDADRLVAVTERGEVISGDKMLILLARYLNVKEVVTTVDASMSIEESGLKTKRTRVGDSAVSAELRRAGGNFGGEPCGAWIFPEVSYCPDGIHAAALVTAMAAEGSLTKMAAEIPSYPIIRGSVHFSTPPDIAAIEDRLMALEPVKLDKTDGLKLTMLNGWLLVRSSGTEPKLRLTVEARSGNEARNIYQRADHLITAMIR